MLRELKFLLSREHIYLQDVYAIFAGYCPTEAMTCISGDWSQTHFKNINSGLEEPMNDEKILLEIRAIGEKMDPYLPSVQITQSYISVADAFRIGKELDIPRVAILFDKAVEENIIPKDIGKPVQQPTKLTKPRTKTGYFKELAKWMGTVKEKEAKADPFVKYLKQNPEAKERARVDKFYSDGIYYLDAQGVSKPTSLRTIQKAINRRIKNGFYKTGRTK